MSPAALSAVGGGGYERAAGAKKNGNVLVVIGISNTNFEYLLTILGSRPRNPPPMLKRYFGIEGGFSSRDTPDRTETRTCPLGLPKGNIE